MTPAERQALVLAARRLAWQLSRLDYCALLMKLGVRRIRLHDIAMQDLLTPPAAW